MVFGPDAAVLAYAATAKQAMSIAHVCKLPNSETSEHDGCLLAETHSWASSTCSASTDIVTFRRRLHRGYIKV